MQTLPGLFAGAGERRGKGVARGGHSLSVKEGYSFD